MLIDTLEQSTVNSQQIIGGERERLLGQNLGYACRNLVSLLCALVVKVLSDIFGLVVGVEHILDLVDSNIALDMLHRSLDKIFRRLQPIDILKTYRRLPRIGFCLLIRLTLNYIFVKFAHIAKLVNFLIRSPQITRQAHSQACNKR